MFPAKILNIRAEASMRRSDRGAIMAEYGLLTMLVLVVAILAVALYGSAIVELFADNNDEYQAVRPASAAQGGQ